jgi:hypothetical protein
MPPRRSAFVKHVTSAVTSVCALLQDDGVTEGVEEVAALHAVRSSEPTLQFNLPLEIGDASH